MEAVQVAGPGGRGAHMRTFRHIRLVENIRQAGKKAHLFAKELGVSNISFGRWCSHPKSIPEEYRPDIKRVAIAWGIDSENLYEWVEDGTPPNKHVEFKAQVEASVVNVQTEVKKVATTREFLYPDELAHFELEQDPFEDIYNPQKIWLGDQQKFVERSILNAVRSHNIIAVVGEVGSGKSTILRRFLSRWEKKQTIRIISLDTLKRQSVSESALSEAICRDLNPGGKIPRTNERRSHQVRLLLERAHQDGIHPVLIIEEAHDLGVDAFIGLKRLWDSFSLYRQLGIVMIGQGRPRRLGLEEADLRWDLGSRLRYDSRIRELGQRTRVIHIHPYDATQVQELLGWRFKSVRGDVTQAFDGSAFEELAGPSAYPLSISNISVLAMRKAFELGDTTVTGDHVAAVAQ